MPTGPLWANRVGGTPEAATRRQGIARPTCRSTARRRPGRTRGVVMSILVDWRLGQPGGGSGPTQPVRRGAGPPRPAVEPELPCLLAEGGDQLVLGHRGAALDVQLPSPLPQLLDAALLVGAPVRGTVLLGRPCLAVVAQGGDQLVLGHRGAALDIQLTCPLAELLDTALLIGASVGA